MKLIIDIPEDVIESAKSSPNYYPTFHFEKIWRAIVNGTPYEERPKGKWELIDNLGRLHRYSCSICGHQIACVPSCLVNYKACYCGAGMRGDV